MKYKGKIEISKKEIDAICGWIEKFIRLDNELHRTKVRIVESLKTAKKHEEDSQDDEPEEEDSLDWEDGDSEEDIQEVHEPYKMDQYQSTSHKFQKGENIAKELFQTWLINFNQEGEQPPRAKIIEDMAKNIDGRELYKYMKHKFDQGMGTTLIMRELIDSSVPNDVIRHMAENFTQVTSILFHQLSDFLRYPNPLDQEEE